MSLNQLIETNFRKLEETGNFKRAIINAHKLGFDTELISLYINNVKNLENLDQLRPGDGKHQSTTGFIGEDQGLFEVMAKDYQTLKEKNVSRFQLAEKLDYVLARYEAGHKIIDGKYEITSDKIPGIQGCPFDDSIFAGTTYTIKNLETGKTIKFSNISSHLIREHGFFEGDVEYRLNPEDVIDIFEIEDMYSVIKREEKAGNFDKAISLMKSYGVDAHFIHKYKKNVKNLGSLDQLYAGHSINQSEGGFLAKGESLFEVMHKDYEAIKDEGLMYVHLGERLKEIMKKANKAASENPKQMTHIIDNKYEVRALYTCGIQGCPFDEERFGGSDYIIKNLKTGESVKAFGITPHLIIEHGFFEGNVNYRTDPLALIRVLDVKQNQGTR